MHTTDLSPEALAQADVRLSSQERLREVAAILAAMGRTLVGVARDSDICCRYGGEEFAVILPLTNVHEAGVLANRMRTELAGCLRGGCTVVTVSMGVASCGEKTRTSRELVEKADAALYQAKRSGKNRVVVIAEGKLGSDVKGTGLPNH